MLLYSNGDSIRIWVCIAYMYVYVCLYVYNYIHTSTYRYIYVCICMYICVCIGCIGQHLYMNLHYMLLRYATVLRLPTAISLCSGIGSGPCKSSLG